MSDGTYIIKDNKFNIDDIVTYLVNIKNVLIKMNIKLDSQEINKFLADSLNNSLFEGKYNKDTAYDELNEKWESINLEPIESQIRKFNLQENYEYYVNLEDVVYLEFYKRIKYTKEIIQEVIQYLNFDVNPIYIYTFIIQSFYDDPVLFSSYIYFIGKIRDTLNDEKIAVFLHKSIVEKLEKILNIIYANDSKFNKLIVDIQTDRINFIKDGIIVTTLSYPNNYNCKERNIQNGLISTKPKGHKTENKDIEILEKHFYQLKCQVLFEKRQLELNDNFYTKLTNLLSSEPLINLELWLGFILFLYKKFDFDYQNEFKPKVDAIIDAKGDILKDYKPKLDYYDDLNVPEYNYENNQLKGGTNIYFNKYLKYKSKYIKLKINKKLN